MNRDLRALNRELTQLTRYLSGTQVNRYFRNTERYQRNFEALLKLPFIKNGLNSIKSLGAAMKQAEDLQKKALATNLSLKSVISKDLVLATIKNGANLTQVTTQLIALREQGLLEVSESTIALAARMKMTGQSTASLIRFLGANTSVMNLNQAQAQRLAKDLSDYAQIYGTRQDEILNLSAQLAKSLRLQAQLGAGGVGAGFAAAGAQLGGRGTELTQQAAQFFAKASLSQLQLLGIAEGFQEQIAAQTDPARQAEIIKQMVGVAAGNLKQLLGGLGTDVTSSKIAEQILKPFGGMEALGFLELAKAFEDAKSPINKLNESITTFGSISNAFTYSFEILGQLLNGFINIPLVGTLIKVTAAIFGFISVVGTLVGAFGLFRFAIKEHRAILAFAVTKFNLAADKMRAAANINASTAARQGGIGGFGQLLGRFLGPASLILGPLSLIPIILGMIESNTSELNDKTPSIKDRDMLNSNLTGQIFSQLVNIVNSQGSNTMESEMLLTQKELVRIARRQFDIMDPQSALPSTPIRNTK